MSFGREQNKKIICNKFLRMKDIIVPSDELNFWLNAENGVGRKYKNLMLEFGEELQRMLMLHEAYDTFKMAIVGEAGNPSKPGLKGNNLNQLNDFFDKFPAMLDYFISIFSQNPGIEEGAKLFSARNEDSKKSLQFDWKKHHQSPKTSYNIIQKLWIKSGIAARLISPDKNSENKILNGVVTIYLEEKPITLTAKEYASCTTMLVLQNKIPAGNIGELTNPIDTAAILKKILKEKPSPDDCMRKLLTGLHDDIWRKGSEYNYMYHGFWPLENAPKSIVAYREIMPENSDIISFDSRELRYYTRLLHNVFFYKKCLPDNPVYSEKSAQEYYSGQFNQVVNLLNI